MRKPLLSIIIPTRDRPHLLPHAVNSALAQTLDDLEVIVVDDASTQMAQLPQDSRLRVIRLEQSRGGSGARNVGTEAAQGRWVTYLDDDDRLLPQMAEVSLAAIARSSATPPIGVISGLEKVSDQGEVIKVRVPPTLCPKGSHFFLEDPEAGRSYATKQTLVVERAVVLQIGGWDEQFRSRVHSEFFLRLNPVCTLIGIPTVTYQLRSHSGTRVSGNPKLRQESFHRLIEKHWVAFESHPRQFAQFVYRHARNSWRQRQFRAALLAMGWALRINPNQTLRNFL
ncbi:MAG: glycosyltransferase [Coleofasciculus sp. B1-GNL1-01]|uniref:glycosyltransferase family 2 protein n=1 Tax=Coleofasciculus sp. B1-GNL1-01 TaxID=3068484 RepID=UPI0033043020